MCCIIGRAPQNRKELKMSNVQITAKNSEQMEIFRTQGHENWVRLEYSIRVNDTVPACCLRDVLFQVSTTLRRTKSITTGAMSDTWHLKWE